MRRLQVPLAILVIAVLPFAWPSAYSNATLTIAALNVMLAMSLNLILGYAGQLNLGQSAFYGIGAYVSTLLVKTAGVAFWPALLCGALGAGLAGVVLSLFAVRLRGHYLGIASLGFALVTYEIITNWVGLTQGPLGIYGIAPPPPLAIPGFAPLRFSNPTAMFYLVAGAALLVYVLLDNLLRSPIADTLRALREDEISAASLGIDCPRWKVFAFGLGCTIAGLAGGFYASFVGTLVPDAFFITESFTLLAMAVVGGLGTRFGPVLGAVLLTLLPELLRGIGDLRLIIYGLALTLCVLFLPGGLVGALAWARRA